MTEKVDLAGVLATFDEAFAPRIVGYYNDSKLMVAKVKGEFVWHAHPETDEGTPNTGDSTEREPAPETEV